MELEIETTGGWVAVAGGALAALAAVMPWVSAGPVSALGIDGDGRFTLLLGLAAVVVVLVRSWEQTDKLVVGLFGAVVIGLAGLVFTNLGSQAAGTFSFSAGIGLYLTVLAGLAMLVAPFVDHLTGDRVPEQRTL